MTKTPKTKPISIRLTDEERAMLERRAGNYALSAYIRLKLFDVQTSRSTTNKSPTKDKQALAQVLALLGKSSLASSMADLAHGARLGTLLVSEETEASIKKACTDIATMKSALMRALGIQEH